MCVNVRVRAKTRRERRQGRDVGEGKGKMWARVMYDACQIVVIKESCVVGKLVAVAIIAVGRAWVYHCRRGRCHRGRCRRGRCRRGACVRVRYIR